MKTGRPKPRVVLLDAERAELKSWAASRSLPHGLVRRAQIVLLAAEGWSNRAIASRVGLGAWSVGKWRARYRREGLQGLYDELRSGRPRSISAEKVATLVRQTLQTRPKNATHWSVRGISEQTALSKSTVHRVWTAFGLQPHRQRHFKLSNPPAGGSRKSVTSRGFI